MLKRAKKYLADFVHMDLIDSLIYNVIVLGLVTILVLLSSLIKDGQFSDNILLKIYVFVEFICMIIFAYRLYKEKI